ncbi:hypothetical protein Hypma_000763 [Hypsizygus marmoreus]|uniref:Uncharacterized protein n=1 Tax=Hypsizygus marmoreus TaxID=39966 RepID=A0A369JE82_HYPMA|nr:hypothetical protein Hypma_000763 [Hypsizygus marmoreus]
MPSIRLPTFFRPRRSFHRLRSFHLSPAEAAAQLNRTTAAVEARPQMPVKENVHYPRNATIPLRGPVITKLALVVSLVFIFSISFSFIGANVDERYFELLLKRATETSPGVVLIGENVDVDIDEPSITIRWSILACGDEFVLPGSAGNHGSKGCGLPAQPLHIFVDSNPVPSATYDPLQIPFNRDTGSRRSIQNLVQFDSDHVLDVHSARLYPFDTYLLSSTLRAASFTNSTVPLRRIATIDTTPSFNIQTTDTESYSTPANNNNSTQTFASRDIDMRVSRPASARIFTLLLFAFSWILAHATIGLVLISRRTTRVKDVLKHLLSAGAILVVLPQLRNSMPDAPGLDGVLIDTIGFFPQMIITGFSVIALLVLVLGLELDIPHHTSHRQTEQEQKQKQKQKLSPPPSPTHWPRPPPTPTENSTSFEVSQYDMHRVAKHLQGEYVFPPVQITYAPDRDVVVTSHRRAKTLSRVTEASKWSD